MGTKVLMAQAARHQARMLLNKDEIKCLDEIIHPGCWCLWTQSVSHQMSLHLYFKDR